MTTKLPQISDDHHFAIANVAARSAQLDHHVERTIEVALPHQPKTAEFMLKNLGTDRVVRLLKAVLIDAAPDETPQIDNLIQTIIDLRAERNEILHWSLGRGIKPGTAVSANHRPFREFRYTVRSADQVQEIADEMLRTTRALIQWQSFLHARLVKPSPDKPEPPTPPSSSASP